MTRGSLTAMLCLSIILCASGQTHKIASVGKQESAPTIAKNPAEISGNASPSVRSIPTEAGLKVAFIGDSGIGANERAVLKLIQAEGAQVVLHQGDFDYHNNPTAFWASVDEVLGADFPYFVSVGNHDVAEWPTTSRPSYAQYLFDRLRRIGVTPDSMELNNEMYSLVFKGLKIVFVGEQRGTGDRVYAPYIKQQLKNDDHTWKVCSWHRNMNAMQVGDKTDDMGWGVYEACREYGAIIATAHEHSYERTKTLSSISEQAVDPTSPDPAQLVAAPGRTFVFVSGLGGDSIRVQRRCLPAVPPYGCQGEWAKIYTSNQNAQYGALFITFNVDGDPNKAHGYFKNVGGAIVDEFDVTKGPSPLNAADHPGKGSK
jgi:hypothetical protein